MAMTYSKGIGLLDGNSGRRVLLVGAGGDIALETARALYEAGYALRCAVHDAREEGLRSR